MLSQQCDVRSTLLGQAVGLVMHVQYNCLVRQLVATRKIDAEENIRKSFAIKTKFGLALQDKLCQ
jgi:hypothetical protein